MRRVLVIVLTVLVVATVTPTQGPTVTDLSQPSATVGSSLTLSGTGFGASQGTSTVTFGRPVNPLGFAPCSTQATVTSWSATSITVTVPAMSPGVAGDSFTHHPVYVTVGGVASNSSDFYITPATTYSNQTFSTTANTGYQVPTSNDVLYRGCTFTATNTSIDGTLYGVVTLGQNGDICRGITFENCTFTGNLGAGSGDGVNCVKLVDWGGRVHDITFSGCTFGASSRMGIEGVEGSKFGLYNLALCNCTFQPMGNEPVSLDFNKPSTGIHDCLIDGCTFQGYDNLAYAPYGGCIECGGQGLEIDNSQIWAGNGPTFNFNGLSAAEKSCIYCNNVTVDQTHVASTQTHVNGGFSCLALWSGVSYTLWQNCSFNVTGMSWAFGNPWGYMTKSCYNTFTNSTITGTTDYPDYVYADSTCVGNVWP